MGSEDKGVMDSLCKTSLSNSRGICHQLALPIFPVYLSASLRIRLRFFWASGDTGLPGPY
jgi:hypothetical protein